MTNSQLPDTKVKSLTCAQCGSNEFFMGSDAILCFKCKAKYKKGWFFGTIFIPLRNAEFDKLPKPFVKGLA